MVRLSPYTRYRQLGCGFWSVWWLVSTFGICVGGAVAQPIADYFFPSEPCTRSGLVGWCFGSFMVFPIMLQSILIAMGIAQCLLLLFVFPRAKWWPLASAAGGVPFLLLDLLLELTGSGGGLVTMLGSIFGVGTITGVGQWLVLNGVVQRSGWWVAVSAITWFVMPPTVLFLGQEFNDEFLLGVLSGSIYSLLTGSTLIWLLAHPASATAPQDDAGRS